MVSFCPVVAQEDTLDVTHNSQFTENNEIVKDSVWLENNDNNNIELTEKSSILFKPNPTRAVFYSIVPGLGQIYNRKYWKLPIIYGGFMGCAYAISWNSTMYNDYKTAYSDVLENGKNAESLKNFLPYGTTSEDLTDSQVQWFTSQFKGRKDSFRRNRDLSYIITVGLYLLSMLDAYVDAQLYDFDISPDLSFKVTPIIYDKSEFNARSLGLQCSIKF